MSIQHRCQHNILRVNKQAKNQILINTTTTCLTITKFGEKNIQILVIFIEDVTIEPIKEVEKPARKYEFSNQ